MNSATQSYDPAADFEVRVFEKTYRSGPGGDWPVRLHQSEGDGPFPALLDTQEAGEDRLLTNSMNYFGTEEAMKEGNPRTSLERGEQLDGS